MYLLNSCSSTWPSSSGIYLLSGFNPDKSYVGRAAGLDGFAGRWCSHRTELRSNSHSNPRLQNAYNHYGPNEAAFCILEEIDSDDALVYNAREAFWIAHLRSADVRFGYNIMSYDENLRIRQSDDTRQILSRKAMGRKHSPKTISRLKDVWKTRVITEAQRANMIAGLRANPRPCSEETKQMIRQKNSGKKRSEEQIKNISIAQKKAAEAAGDGHWNAKSHKCIAPNGEIIVIQNLTRFCRQHNLCRAAMERVCANKTLSSSGYRSLSYVDKRYRDRKYDFMSPSGQIYPCSVISAFEKEHDLYRGYIRRLLNGSDSSKGWRLVKDYTKL